MKLNHAKACGTEIGAHLDVRAQPLGECLLLAAPRESFVAEYDGTEVRAMSDDTTHCLVHRARGLLQIPLLARQRDDRGGTRALCLGRSRRARARVIEVLPFECDAWVGPRREREACHEHGPAEGVGEINTLAHLASADGKEDGPVAALDVLLILGYGLCERVGVAAGLDHRVLPRRDACPLARFLPRLDRARQRVVRGKENEHAVRHEARDTGDGVP